MAESALHDLPFEPRWMHKIIANALGYFWLPCPLCGEPFGGHEWRDIDGKASSIPDVESPGTHHGICPSCTRAGKGWHVPLGMPPR